MASSALASWELENAVQLIDPVRDALYDYPAAAHNAVLDAKPYKTNPKFFTSVRISAVALLKMVMHARSGGSIEIMGLMTGYVTNAGEFVVTDAFRLPVEGTETRVNAHQQAEQYMVEFPSLSRDAGYPDNVVGWYHSHPGYGCWLSGIDVQTQMLQQSLGAFVAVVIDPDRTISAGKVEIGAFRTYTDVYSTSTSTGPGGTAATPASTTTGGPAGASTTPQPTEKDTTDLDGFQSIPVNKIEDFGAHADRYYSLDVTHFKSSLDTRLLEALWHKYWVSTLSSSPLFTNREYGTRQMLDLAQKIRMADGSAGGAGGAGSAPTSKPLAGRDRTGAKLREKQLEKLMFAGNKIAAEERAGLMAADVKEKLFTGVGLGLAAPSGGGEAER